MAIRPCKECRKDISTAATACPHCGAKVVRTSVLTWIVAFFLVLIGIGWLRASLDGDKRAAEFTPEQRSAAVPEKKSAYRQARDDVAIKSFSWETVGFSNVMLLTMTIHNKGPRAVKDLVIGCTHSAPSGTVIDRSSRTLYQTLSAKSVRTVKGFNMGVIDSQTAHSGCAVIDLTVLVCIP